MENTKTNRSGLVLEGGGMRGMYTAGILDVLMEENVDIDVSVGVSAGALFGVNYVSGQIGRAIRYNKRFNSDRNYMGIKPLLKEGNIVSTKYAYELVPRKLDPFDDEAFKASDKEFYAVATNIETGKAEYFPITDPFPQMDILRASGSMPLVSKPVEINGSLYLDGGIGDSIPFIWLAHQGVKKMVVILTRDESYKKKPMSPLLTRLYKKKHPKFARRMELRHKLYNTQLEMLKEWEEKGRAFVFRPSEPIKISRTERDPVKLQGVYELGREDALRRIERLKAYLSE